MQHISDFLDAMRAAGVGPSDPNQIKDDDIVNRYHVDGDKPKTKNGVYQLKADADGFAVGWFMSHREGDVHKWHSKATSRSKEDKEIHRAKLESSRREREAAIKKQHKETAARAANLWSKATRGGSTGYLERKRIGLNGAKVMGDLAVVPMYKDGSLVGLQFIAPDGTKRFLTGVDKSGSYYSMRGNDMSVIRICEGFSTACAIRDAYPVNPVVVAWDAGNLKPVAKAMRAKYPDAQIIICADNDQWTEKKDGTLFNPGLENARQAAVTIGGASVVWPEFGADDKDKRTDWWDWWSEFGADGVRSAMDAATVAREPDEDTPLDGEVIDDRTPPKFKNIRPLGHNRGYYYFLPNNGGQIIKKSASDLARIERLFDLAPLGFWETYYNLDGKTSHSDMAKFAANELIEVCHSIGVWDGKETRGVGVWRENIGPICNTGSLIVGSGIKEKPNLFKGKHIYETGSNIIDLDIPPATDGEAKVLFDICTSLSWKRPQYGYLLAGWLVVAPVGGALKWKPHIWLTGRSGSGKSTVMDAIIKAILGDYAVCRDGGTTEPGVRKALGVSSRPFVMDEAESESAYDRQKMEAIIGLFRKASSGGVIGNADSYFQAMSCACFAAINPAVRETADKARITLLELEKDTRKDANARYLSLMDTIHQTIEGNYSQRIFARTFSRVDVLLHNISAFENAAADMFGDKRQADQLAPMIAGAHFLVDGNKISVTDARKWLEQQDWQWYTSISDETDAQKLVSRIMSSRVSYDSIGMRREGAIGDLIEIVAEGGEHSADVSRGLRAYGIKVENGRLLIANGSAQMERLLSNSPWVPWARTLGDYPGADNYNNKSVYFMAGVTSKVVSIPLDGLVDRVEEADEMEIPLEVEEWG